MRRKPSNQLRTIIDTKIEGEMRQQLYALLLTLLESKVQASVDLALAHWIASLVRQVAQTIEKVCSTTISTLLLNL